MCQHEGLTESSSISFVTAWYISEIALGCLTQSCSLDKCIKQNNRANKSRWLWSSSRISKPRQRSRKYWAAHLCITSCFPFLCLLQIPQNIALGWKTGAVCYFHYVFVVLFFFFSKWNNNSTASRAKSNWSKIKTVKQKITAFCPLFWVWRWGVGGGVSGSCYGCVAPSSSTQHKPPCHSMKPNRFSILRIWRKCWWACECMRSWGLVILHSHMWDPHEKQTQQKARWEATIVPQVKCTMRLGVGWHKEIIKHKHWMNSHDVKKKKIRHNPKRKCHFKHNVPKPHKQPLNTQRLLRSQMKYFNRTKYKQDQCYMAGHLMKCSQTASNTVACRKCIKLKHACPQSKGKRVHI